MSTIIVPSELLLQEQAQKLADQAGQIATASVERAEQATAAQSEGTGAGSIIASEQAILLNEASIAQQINQAGYEAERAVAATNGYSLPPIVTP